MPRSFYPSVRLTGGCVGPTASLGGAEKRQISAHIWHRTHIPRSFNPQRNHYSDGSAQAKFVIIFIKSSSSAVPRIIRRAPTLNAPVRGLPLNRATLTHISYSEATHRIAHSTKPHYGSPATLWLKPVENILKIWAGQPRN